MKLTIKGQLQSKANSRRVTSSGRIIKSVKAMEFEEAALWQLKSQWKQKPLTEGVGLDVDVFYSSRRPDLDISLLMDVLEKAGVYENDRQVTEFTARKHLDKEDPRVQVSVYETDRL